MLRKESGDEIAKIFNRLMKKNSIEKTAGESGSPCSSDQAVESNVEDGAVPSDQEGSDLMSKAADMLIDDAKNLVSDEASSNAEAQINAAKDVVTDYFVDKKSANIMKGLGKIAASLRSKGELFAADVVEATAISINEDIKNERLGSVKSNVKTARCVNELRKISSEIRLKDSFAADLVDATINKISNPEQETEENVENLEAKLF